MGRILGQKPERAQVASDAECAMIWGQEAAENFKDVTPAARRRILCDNARALYGP
jgi:predicted TIM-barrel fold metal-dependent hydrolase